MIVTSKKITFSRVPLTSGCVEWPSYLSGYVQGMSDLLAPILLIMDNETDSFWCFVGLMNMVVSPFLHVSKWSA